MTRASAVQLVFPDRKQRGRFPVHDEAGAVVALISTAWTSTSFTATDADLRPLCAGRAARWGLSGRWVATGPDGASLLELRKSTWRSSAELTLARGGTFAIHGSAWKRDFTITVVGSTDPVVSAVPRTKAMSLHPYDYSVQQHEPVLDLAELVAAVQLWRLVRKNDDAAAGAAAATIAVTSG
jgi:hypothetical protein